jgi:hypothetical protein
MLPNDKLPKSKLAYVLMSPFTTEYNKLVIYIVYKTLKANGRLTLNQLRHLLFGDLLLSPTLVEGAVSVLSSRSMFNCVSMYQLKMTRPEALPNFHLDVKDNPEFLEWLSETEHDHPEFLQFDPPIYMRRPKQVAVV